MSTVKLRGRPTPKSPGRLPRKSATLVYDLPPEIDALPVAQGYKGKEGPYALNTLVHRLAALSKAHQNLSVDNPCNYIQVRELLKNVRSGLAKRGVKPHKAGRAHFRGARPSRRPPRAVCKDQLALPSPARVSISTEDSITLHSSSFRAPPVADCDSATRSPAAAGVGDRREDQELAQGQAHDAKPLYLFNW
jgi:hypothetical protein